MSPPVKPPLALMGPEHVREHPLGKELNCILFCISPPAAPMSSLSKIQSGCAAALPAEWDTSVSQGEEQTRGKETFRLQCAEWQMFFSFFFFWISVWQFFLYPNLIFWPSEKNVLSYGMLHKEWVIEISTALRTCKETFIFVPFLLEVALKAMLPVFSGILAHTVSWWQLFRTTSWQVKPLCSLTRYYFEVLPKAQL